jgi:hypothetical protein
MEVSSQCEAPAALPLHESYWHHWVQDWVGAGVDLDATEKRESLDSAGNRNPIPHFSVHNLLTVLTQISRLKREGITTQRHVHVW